MTHTPFHTTPGGPSFFTPPVKDRAELNANRGRSSGVNRPALIPPKPKTLAEKPKSNFLDSVLDLVFPTPSAPITIETPTGTSYPKISLGSDEYMEAFQRGGFSPEIGQVDPEIGKTALPQYAPAFRNLLDKHPIIVDPEVWGGGYTHLVTRPGNDRSIGSPVYIGADPGSPEFNSILQHELSHIAMIEILGKGSVSKLNEQVELFQMALREVAADEVPDEMVGQIFDEDGGLSNFRNQDDFLQWLQFWGVEGGKPLGLNDPPHIDDRPGELFSEVLRWSGGDISTIPEKLRPFFKDIIDPNYVPPVRFHSGAGVGKRSTLISRPPNLIPPSVLGGTPELSEQPPFQGIKIFEEAEGTINEVPANFDLDAFNVFVEQFPDIAERSALKGEIIFAGRLIPRDEFTDQGLKIAEEFLRQHEQRIETDRLTSKFQERMLQGFKDFRKIDAGEFEFEEQAP